jgi:hypothetical protein
LFEALSKIKQDESYKLVIPNKDYAKNGILQADLEEIVVNRLQYLDVMASLHASFTFSPVVRLPIQSRGINRFLSFFFPYWSFFEPFFGGFEALGGDVRLRKGSQPTTISTSIAKYVIC